MFIYDQTNALARQFNLCISTIRTESERHYCCNNFRILHNLSPLSSTSYMFAINYVKSFNERIRSSIFSLSYRLEKSDNPYFL